MAYLMQAEQAYRQGRFRYALALTDTARQVDPDLADVPFLRARIFTQIRRLGLADSAYAEVAELAPSYTGLWFNRGNLAFRRGQYEEAIAHYRRAHSPDLQARVLTNLGRAYANLGRTDSARAAYQRALRADPNYTTAHGWLSRLFQEEGQLDSAIVHARAALERKPSDYDYRYLVGSQLVQAGRPEEAIPMLDSVLSARPSHRGAHYNLGRAYTLTGRDSLGRFHQAVADSLEKLQSEVERRRTYAQDNPKDPGAWIALGDLLRKLSRYEEALQAYQLAQTLAPANTVIRNNVANLYLETGDTTRALGQYRSLLRQDSSAVDIWFNLGVLYANMGRDEEAREAWNQVLERQPDHRRAREYIGMLEDG